MASPFPGMDPYLEQPAFWSSFHTRFMVAIADTLDARLFPQYYVDVETRTYIDENDHEILVGVPDALILTTPATPSNPGFQASPEFQRSESQSSPGLAVASRVELITLPMPEEVRERYLEIREVSSNETVTVIELLSPKNKQAGPGRTAYLRKRQQVLASLTHLVEIDVLRANRPMPWVGGTLKDYHIVVSRSERRPEADLYSFSIQDAMPTIAIPLKSEETIALDLQTVFTELMMRAHYDSRIDYTQPIPPPKPSPIVQAWINEKLM